MNEETTLRDYLAIVQEIRAVEIARHLAHVEAESNWFADMHEIMERRGLTQTQVMAVLGKSRQAWNEREKTMHRRQTKYEELKREETEDV